MAVTGGGRAWPTTTKACDHAGIRIDAGGQWVAYDDGPRRLLIVNKSSSALYVRLENP